MSSRSTGSGFSVDSSKSPDQDVTFITSLGSDLKSFSEVQMRCSNSCCQSPAAAAAKSLQSCLTLCDPIDGSPPGSAVPGISPGKNTGVGCHFLLQCMKVKSKSEVAQSCPTLCDPIDCSLQGSSVHGIFQARVLEWGAIAFSGLPYSLFSKLHL